MPPALDENHPGGGRGVLNNRNHSETQNLALLWRHISHRADWTHRPRRLRRRHAHGRRPHSRSTPGRRRHGRGTHGGRSRAARHERARRGLSINNIWRRGRVNPKHAANLLCRGLCVEKQRLRCRASILSTCATHRSRGGAELAWRPATTRRRAVRPRQFNGRKDSV